MLARGLYGRCRAVRAMVAELAEEQGWSGVRSFALVDVEVYIGMDAAAIRPYACGAEVGPENRSMGVDRTMETSCSREAIRGNARSTMAKKRQRTNGRYPLWAVILVVVVLSSSGVRKTAGALLPAVFEVNFQKFSTGACADGMAVDIGEAFGDRGNFLKYGWLLEGMSLPIDVKINARDYWEGLDDSCLRRTFVHMQYYDCCSDKPQEGFSWNVMWRIEVPNGSYRLTVICGEPSSYDSTHAISANDVVILPATMANPQHTTMTASAELVVTDGQITLSAADGGYNTKLSYVRIETLADEPPCVPFPSAFDGQSISPLACKKIRVATPYHTHFNSPLGGLRDKYGVPIGFTMFVASSEAKDAYKPELIEVRDDVLLMTTTQGRLNRHLNSQVNAFGVGLEVPDFDITVSAKFRVPENLQGRYERCCIWLAVSDRDHLKVCYASTGHGEKFFVHYERDDEKVFRKYTSPVKLDSSRVVQLRMELYSILDEVKTFLVVGEDDSRATEFVSTYNAVQFFNKDAAGTDYEIGTRSFAGVFVSQAFRREDTVTFELLDFSVDTIKREPDVINIPHPDIDFETWFLTRLPNPTSLVYGPDGKLYVALVDGRFAVIEVDHENKVEMSRTLYEAIGTRLLLGIAIDPASTSESVAIWLSHSSPSQDFGEANSGVITKVSGANFEVVENVITGLPRAMANHGPNNLKFGPDGRLYIGVGGNTAGGVPNSYETSDFGSRPEQCLSAALLVADVTASGFRGDCTPSQDPASMDVTGIGAACEDVCDVEIFASGVRNPFDFTFQDGHLYMTDNGLGGKGTAPLLSDGHQFGDACDGPVMGDRTRKQDPGKRNDLLLDVKEGGYYGHPNPARRECVYYGGNPTEDEDSVIPGLVDSNGSQANFSTEFRKYQVGTQPEPNYESAMFSLGESHSANGIISFDSDVFCGELRGDLLTTFYSQEDQVRRLVLNDDGTRVVADSVLPKTTVDTGAEVILRNPLSLTQDPHGNLYISEFFGGKVRVLDPIGGQCSMRMEQKSFRTPLRDMEKLSSMGAATYKNKIFTVGGYDHRSGVISSAIHVFDTFTKEWSVLPESLPDTVYSSATVHTDNGKIFAFGGYNADHLPTAVVVEIDTRTGKVVEKDRMPEQRASATAQYFNGKVWLLGGVDAQGHVSASVSVYDVRTGEWTQKGSMQVPRLGAASVHIDGRIYICGGVDKDNKMLDHCESFDGTTWQHMAPMPTGRGHAGMTAVHGKIVVVGGEAAASTASSKAEEYDPATDSWTELPPLKTGRTRAAVVRLGSGIFFIGGRTHSVLEERLVDSEVLYYK